MRVELGAPPSSLNREDGVWARFSPLIWTVRMGVELGAPSSLEPWGWGLSPLVPPSLVPLKRRWGWCHYGSLAYLVVRVPRIGYYMGRHSPHTFSLRMHRETSKASVATPAYFPSRHIHIHMHNMPLKCIATSHAYICIHACFSRRHVHCRTRARFSRCPLHYHTCVLFEALCALSHTCVFFEAPHVLSHTCMLFEEPRALSHTCTFFEASHVLFNICIHIHIFVCYVHFFLRAGPTTLGMYFEAHGSITLCLHFRGNHPRTCTRVRLTRCHIVLSGCSHMLYIHAPVTRFLRHNVLSPRVMPSWGNHHTSTLPIAQHA